MITFQEKLYGLKQGCHDRAYYNQRELYESTVNMLRNHKKAADTSETIEALDFGTGPYGVARMILGNVLSSRLDHLSLFDPYAEVRKPRRNNEKEITGDKIYGPMPTRFDIISLSYLLCCMEPEKAQKMLQGLLQAQHDATYIFIDYTLQGMTREQVLALLVSDREIKWRTDMGDDDFFRTRTQHTRASLAALVQSSGFELIGNEAMEMDPNGYRAGMVARANV